MAVTLVGFGAAKAEDNLGATWPDISTSVTTINNYVVAQGMTTGPGGNRVVWQTPLVPAGVSVSVQHGISTTFVQAGQRQFVIDDATGRATELRNGVLYQRLEPQKGQAVSTQGPAQARPPGRPIVRPAPAQPSPTYVVTDPAVQQLMTYQMALQQLMADNSLLLQTMQDLSQVQQMKKLGQATAEDVAKIQRDVQEARLRVRKDQDILAKLAAPPAAVVAPAPIVDLTHLTPRDRLELQRAEEGVLRANERVIRSGQAVERLKQAGMFGDEPAALDAKRDLADANRQLQQAKARLEIVRTRLGLEYRCSVFSPELCARLAAAERAMIDQRLRVQRAEARLREAQKARSQGTGSEEAVTDATNSLMAEIAKLNSQEQELTELHEMGYRQAAPPAKAVVPVVPPEVAPVPPRPPEAPVVPKTEPPAAPLVKPVPPPVVVPTPAPEPAPSTAPVPPPPPATPPATGPVVPAPPPAGQ